MNREGTTGLLDSVLQRDRNRVHLYLPRLLLLGRAPRGVRRAGHLHGIGRLVTAPGLGGGPGPEGGQAQVVDQREGRLLLLVPLAPLGM